MVSRLLKESSWYSAVARIDLAAEVLHLAPFGQLPVPLAEAPGERGEFPAEALEPEDLEQREPESHLPRVGLDRELQQLDGARQGAILVEQARALDDRVRVLERDGAIDGLGEALLQVALAQVVGILLGNARRELRIRVHLPPPVIGCEDRLPGGWRALGGDVHRRLGRRLLPVFLGRGSRPATAPQVGRGPGEEHQRSGDPRPELVGLIPGSGDRGLRRGRRRGSYRRRRLDSGWHGRLHRRGCGGRRRGRCGFRDGAGCRRRRDIRGHDRLGLRRGRDLGRYDRPGLRLRGRRGRDLGRYDRPGFGLRGWRGRGDVLRRRRRSGRQRGGHAGQLEPQLLHLRFELAEAVAHRQHGRHLVVGIEHREALAQLGARAIVDGPAGRKVDHGGRQLELEARHGGCMHGRRRGRDLAVRRGHRWVAGKRRGPLARAASAARPPARRVRGAAGRQPRAGCARTCADRAARSPSPRRWDPRRRGRRARDWPRGSPRGSRAAPPGCGGRSRRRRIAACRRDAR